MAVAESLLIIPVENQVRELDPKLLLACVAAQRGFTSLIGFRREIHFQVGAFPPGIYLSKSMTDASNMMFRIMRKLGHRVVAWDEEALVHLPDEIYYSRRLSPAAMHQVSHFFAWGQDSADLWRRFPQFPPGTPVHVTGNPRCDLLRPEVRQFYRQEVERLREQHGDFILVNTNFNHVNAFSPVQNLFQPQLNPEEEPKFGRSALGMTREYALKLRDLKQGMFEAFQTMIVALEKAFPRQNVIVRPHPTENPAVYHRIAQRCSRVKVTNEGNVVPWLMACRCIIHNGCTTGVEAYVLGTPAISYRAVVNEEIDYGFYRLPNLVSHQCFSLNELLGLLQDVLTGKAGAAVSGERDELIDRHLAATKGPMASERIVDVLESMVAGSVDKTRHDRFQRLHGHLWATGRTVVKRIKSRLPRSHNKPEFQRHRYPQISLEDVQNRVDRFREITGFAGKIAVRRFGEQFFTVST
jgi:surface carbohydrate biosynthesis protein